MQVALPFGRGAFIWGEPIEVETDLDEAGVERARKQIEARMLGMVAKAEACVGHHVFALVHIPDPDPAPSKEPAEGPQLTPELAGGERR
jgi:hypothetical protein